MISYQLNVKKTCNRKNLLKVKAPVKSNVVGISYLNLPSPNNNNNTQSNKILRIESLRLYTADFDLYSDMTIKF